MQLCRCPPLVPAGAAYAAVQPSPILPTPGAHRFCPPPPLRTQPAGWSGSTLPPERSVSGVQVRRSRETRVGSRRCEVFVA